jgi:3-methyladenine DNA glycosylase AlkD
MIDVRELDAALRAAGRPERAVGEKAYLKSTLTHLGVGLPGMRKLARGVRRAHPGATRRELLALLDALWAEPVFDRRMVVVELLDVYRDLLEPGDLPRLLRWIRASRTWALVDPLAVVVVGGLVERHPEVAERLDGWARDDDFWVRRAAMLALLRPLRAGGGDFARFARYADAMLEEKEFFIRKAIGWVLREVSKRRPALVADWIAPRARRASGVTLREAVKYLPAARRTAILARR